MFKAVLKTIGILFVFLFMFGLVEAMLSSDSKDPEKIEADVEEIKRPNIDFEVIKDKSDAYKRSVEVVLTERISEGQLESLAKYLYEDRSGNTFIGYYIDGEGDYAYWATTHYDPDMNVRIIGSDQAQEQMLSDTSDDTDDDIIGRWRVSRGINYVITLAEIDGQKRLIQRFQDGSEMNNPVQETTINGQTRLSDGIGVSNGEYYVIGNDGWLQFWSDNGNYYTAPKAD